MFDNLPAPHSQIVVNNSIRVKPGRGCVVLHSCRVLPCPDCRMRFTMARSRRPIPEFIQNPFKVVVDSNETTPYLFRGISRKHASGVSLPLVVDIVRKPLWATDPLDIQVRRGKHIDTHRVGYADYSIDGLERHIQIERKSISDLFGTIGGRRGRFEAEITRLDRDCKAAYVVIEADWPQISIYSGEGIDPAFDRSPNPVIETLFGNGPTSDNLDVVVDSRPRKGKTQPSVVLGTIASWSMKYRNVHWMLCGNRAMGEAITFKLLSEFWEKVQEGYYIDIDPVV